MKLPEISMAEWENAEAELRNRKNTPQPKGTITPDQYAEMKNIGVSHARKRLVELVKGGLATQEKWRTHGKIFTVYRRKK